MAVVYISLLQARFLAGNITGNASGRYGGGICVNMPIVPDTDESVPATINFGNNELGGFPVVNSNSASLAGGGIYVYGSHAEVILNEGTVKENSTSAYQINSDIAVQGDGLVTLNAEDITTQVKITFNNNNLYYNSGSDDESYQYVVSATNNKLKPQPFGSLDSYYTKFNGWDTRRDGKGAQKYSDQQVVRLEQDITLYARWTH